MCKEYRSPVSCLRKDRRGGPQVVIRSATVLETMDLVHQIKILLAGLVAFDSQDNAFEF